MMDWKALGESIAKVGLPLLGAVLPLPGGAAIGTALASMLGSKPDPDSILQALSASSDAMQKAKQFEYQHQETMLKMTLDAQVAQVDSVNKTLQTEAMGGSWLQRNHHAIESLLVVGNICAIYFILPLLSIPVPSIPEAAFIMLGAILGVTAWQRGAANVATAKGGSNGS